MFTPQWNPLHPRKRINHEIHAYIKPIDRLRSNLKEIEARKNDLKSSLAISNNDQFREPCLGLRIDVDLTFEIALREMTQQRDEMLKEIEDYESQLQVP